MQSGRIRAIKWLWEPGERVNEGFEMVGRVSELFARYYAEHTLEGTDVVQLHAPSRPQWFAL